MRGREFCGDDSKDDHESLSSPIVSEITSSECSRLWKGRKANKRETEKKKKKL